MQQRSSKAIYFTKKKQLKMLPSVYGLWLILLDVLLMMLLSIFLYH